MKRCGGWVVGSMVEHHALLVVTRRVKLGDGYSGMEGGSTCGRLGCSEEIIMFLASSCFG
jgi:hypothetical protein